MLSDIKLNNNRVEVEGTYLQFKGVDFLLDNTDRRGTRNRTRPRRALVHDFQDGLTINWANDYPGGVTINNGKIINLTLDGKIIAKETIKAEKGIEIKKPYGLTVGGSAKVGETLTAKDVRLTRLGYETQRAGRLGVIPRRPKSVVDVIKAMERKIAALERKVQRLENG